MKPLRPEFDRAVRGPELPSPPSPPSATDDFNAAANGPRKTIATPDKRLELTPGGMVEQSVHEAIDEKARKTNRERDALVRGEGPKPERTLTERFNKATRTRRKLRDRRGGAGDHSDHSDR